MTRKPLILGASALLLALPLLAVPAVAGGFVVNDVAEAKAETTVKTVEIKGARTATNTGSPNYHGVYIPTDLLAKNATYSGSYYDVSGAVHDVDVYNQGEAPGVDGYHLIQVRVNPMIDKTILKKETVFTNKADATDTFFFDKDYLITFKADWQAPTVVEYTGPIVKSLECVGANASQSKPSFSKYRIYVTLSVTTYGHSYSGKIYDVSGNEYDVSFKNEGSEVYGESGTKYHMLDCALANWSDNIVIKKDTIFIDTVDMTAGVSFDKDYLIAYEGEGVAPSVVEYTTSAEVDYFVKTYMHPEIEATDTGTGKCLGADGYYAKAKAAYQKLSADAKNLFDTDSNYAAYKARYDAWASFNEGIDTGSKSAFGRKTKEESYVIPVIASLSLAVGVSVAAMLFLRKKRNNQ